MQKENAATLCSGILNVFRFSVIHEREAYPVVLEYLAVPECENRNGQAAQCGKKKADLIPLPVIFYDLSDEACSHYQDPSEPRKRTRVNLSLDDGNDVYGAGDKEQYRGGDAKAVLDGLRQTRSMCHEQKVLDEVLQHCTLLI